MRTTLDLDDDIYILQSATLLLAKVKLQVSSPHNWSDWVCNFKPDVHLKHLRHLSFSRVSRSGVDAFLRPIA